MSALSLHWPESTHVELINMRGAADEAIWSLARDHGFTLVSKDDDFRSLALVRGAPPKVVWLQIGNAPTPRVADLLSANIPALEAFANENCLEPMTRVPELTQIVEINDMECWNRQRLNFGSQSYRMTHWAVL